MEFDIYLRQLVALCMHKKPEKPDGFKPPEPAEKTGVGMIGNNLIKKLARAKYENEFQTKKDEANEQKDQQEGGSQEEEEEGEYDDEDGSDESVAASVKSLEWVKPVIQIKQVIEEVTSLRSSQASGINLKGEESVGYGDIDTNNQTFKIPNVKMADSKQR